MKMSDEQMIEAVRILAQAIERGTHDPLAGDEKFCQTYFTKEEVIKMSRYGDEEEG